MLILLLPVASLLYRIPGRYWAHPSYAPLAALSTLIAVYAIDCLLNAFVNPVFVLSLGALAGVRPEAFAVEREPAGAEELSVDQHKGEYCGAMEHDQGLPLGRFGLDRAEPYPFLFGEGVEHSVRVVAEVARRQGDQCELRCGAVGWPAGFGHVIHVRVACSEPGSGWIKIWSRP